MKTIRGEWNEAPGAVTLIDAHHHLWDLKANRYPFLTDQPEPHFFLGRMMRSGATICRKTICGI